MDGLEQGEPKLVGSFRGLLDVVDPTEKAKKTLEKTVSMRISSRSNSRELQFDVEAVQKVAPKDEGVLRRVHGVDPPGRNEQSVALQERHLVTRVNQVS